MPLGYDTERRIVNIGDSAELYAYLYDEEDVRVPAANLSSVVFTVERPDEGRFEEAGAIQSDGTGFLRYTETDLSGEYVVVATFTFVNGQVKSTRSDFQVVDPFTPPLQSGEQLIADRVWAKVQDCFDSSDGGPWMRDMTMNVFGPDRIPDFLDEAMFDINITNPETDATIDLFLVADTNNHYHDLPLLVQGTFLAVVRHLMRSYAEQSSPQGGQIAYEDRRDYLQRWGTIYQIESQLYKHWVTLWKRKFLQLGHSKSLVSSKAGRLLPAPLRSRNIGRGYY